MRARLVIYIIATAVIGAFLIANWALLSSPVSLSLLFARVEAPLAILLLLCAGFVLSLDLAIHALAEHAWRAERRQLMNEVAGARLRAERREEEQSLAQGLRATVEHEFAVVRTQLDRVVSAVQRLENDTMDVPLPPSPSSTTPSRAIEPELIPPRPG